MIPRIQSRIVTWILFACIMISLLRPVASQAWSVNCANPVTASGYVKIDSSCSGLNNADLTVTGSSTQGLWLVTGQKFKTVRFMQTANTISGFIFSMTGSTGITTPGGANSFPSFHFEKAFESLTVLIDSSITVTNAAERIFRFKDKLLSSTLDIQPAIFQIAAASALPTFHFEDTVSSVGISITGAVALAAATGQPYLSFGSNVQASDIVIKSVSTNTALPAELMSFGNDFKSSSTITISSCLLSFSNSDAISVSNHFDGSTISVISSTISTFTNSFLSVSGDFKSSSASISLSTLVGRHTFNIPQKISNTGVTITSSSVTVNDGSVLNLAQTSNTQQPFSFHGLGATTTITGTNTSSSTRGALVAIAGTRASGTISLSGCTITSQSGLVHVSASSLTNALTIVVTSSARVTGRSFLTAAALAGGVTVSINGNALVTLTNFLVQTTSSIGSSTISISSATVSITSFAAISIGNAASQLSLRIDGGATVQVSSFGTGSLISAASLTGFSAVVVGATVRSDSHIFIINGATSSSISFGSAAVLSCMASSPAVVLFNGETSGFSISTSGATLTAVGASISVLGTSHTSLGVTLTGSTVVTATATSDTTVAMVFAPSSVCTLCGVSVTSSTIYGVGSGVFLSSVAGFVFALRDGAIIVSPRGFGVALGNGVASSLISMASGASLVCVTNVAGSCALVCSGVQSGDVISGLGVKVDIGASITTTNTGSAVNPLGAVLAVTASTSLLALSIRIVGCPVAFSASSLASSPELGLIFIATSVTISRASITFIDASLTHLNSKLYLITMASTATITSSSIEAECVYSAGVSSRVMMALSGVVRATTVVLDRLIWFRSASALSFSLPIVSFDSASSVGNAVVIVTSFLNSSDVVTASAAGATAVSSISVACSMNGTLPVVASTFPANLQSVVVPDSNCFWGTTVRNCGATPSESKSRTQSSYPTVTPSVSAALPSATESRSPSLTKGSVSSQLTSSDSLSKSPSHTHSETSAHSQSETATQSESLDVSSSDTDTLSPSYSESPSASASPNDLSRSATGTHAESETFSRTPSRSRGTLSAPQSYTPSSSISLSNPSKSPSMTSVYSLTSSKSGPSTSISPTPSLSESPTTSMSLERSASSTHSLSRSKTRRTASSSKQKSQTRSASVLGTASASLSRTLSATGSTSLTGYISSTASTTQSRSQSFSLRPSATLSQSASPTASLSATPSLSPGSVSQPATATVSRSATVSRPSASRTVSLVDSPTRTVSRPSPSSTASVLASVSLSRTVTLTVSNSNSLSLTRRTHSRSTVATATATISTTTPLTSSVTLTSSRTLSLSTSSSLRPSTSKSYGSLSKSFSVSRSTTKSTTVSTTPSQSHSTSANVSTSLSSSSSATATTSRTATVSLSLLSRTQVQSSTVSLSVSRTVSSSRSRSRTASDTTSHSTTASASRVMSASHTITRSRTITVSAHVSKTASRSESLSHTATLTLSRSLSVSSTFTSTTTKSKSSSQSQTATYTAPVSLSQTRSASLSGSMSDSKTVSGSESGSATWLHSASLTASETKTKTFTNSASVSNSTTGSITLRFIRRTKSNSHSALISSSMTRRSPTPSITYSKTYNTSALSVTRKTKSFSVSLSNATVTHSPLPTPTSTRSVTPTMSLSSTVGTHRLTLTNNSRSISLTGPTPSVSRTRTPSATDSSSFSQNQSLSTSASLTQARSFSLSTSVSLSLTHSSTPSLSLTRSRSLSMTFSASVSASPSSSRSLSQTRSTSISPSRSSTATNSATLLRTLTTTVSRTLSTSLSNSSTGTGTASVSASLNVSVTVTAALSSTLPSLTQSGMSETIFSTRTRSASDLVSQSESQSNTDTRSRTVRWSDIAGVVVNETARWQDRSSVVVESTSGDGTSSLHHHVLDMWLFPVYSDGTSPPAEWFVDQLTPSISVVFPTGSSRSPLVLRSATCYSLPCRLTVECIDGSFDDGEAIVVDVRYPLVGVVLPPLTVYVSNLNAAATFLLKSALLRPSGVAWVRDFPSARLGISASSLVSGNASIRIAVAGGVPLDDGTHYVAPLGLGFLTAAHLQPDISLLGASALNVTFAVAGVTSSVTVSLALEHCEPRLSQQSRLAVSPAAVFDPSTMTEPPEVVFPFPMQGALDDDDVECETVRLDSRFSRLAVSPVQRHTNGCSASCTVANLPNLVENNNDDFVLLRLVGKLSTRPALAAVLATRPIVYGNTAPVTAALSRAPFVYAQPQDNTADPRAVQIILCDTTVRYRVSGVSSSERFVDDRLTRALLSADVRAANVSSSDASGAPLSLLEWSALYDASTGCLRLSLVLGSVPISGWMRVALNASVLHAVSTPHGSLSTTTVAASPLDVFVGACYRSVAVASALAGRSLLAALVIARNSTKTQLNLTAERVHLDFCQGLIHDTNFIVHESGVCDALASSGRITNNGSVTRCSVVVVCPFFVATGAAVEAHTLDNLTQSHFPVLAAPDLIAYPESSADAFTFVSVSGCALDVFPHTAGCSIRATNTLVLDGIVEPWQHSRASALFNNSNSRVRVEVFFAAGIPGEPAHSCNCDVRNMTLNNTGGTHRVAVACAISMPCYGRHGTVVMELLGAAGTGQRIAALPSSVSFENWLNCPLTVDDQVFECSGNGHCDRTVGRCRCYGSLETGFWAGSACSECAAQYVGSANCDQRCPSAIDGVACSGKGTCINGACMCDAGASGVDCGDACPSAAGAPPCSGHGICSPVDEASRRMMCTCFGDASSGFWSGEDCSECAAGYGGSACTAACPTTVPGTACSGHGSCDSTTLLCRCDATWCGSDCGSPATGASCSSSCQLPHVYGPSCDLLCPGYALAFIACSGHGSCDSGVLGSGLCACDPMFRGADCSIRCPTGSSGVVCSGKGSCNAVGTCECQVGFAGPACSIACPGAASGTGAVCSGHGTCQDGSNGDGRCQCVESFAGNDCSHTCLSEGPVCSGHGSCGPKGVCSCDASSVSGFWAGPACATCVDGYHGSRCHLHCTVGSNGRPCSGHGTCDSVRAVCNCYQDARLGHWSGDVCSACSSGYFGSECNRECPGSACEPCSGNGVCSDGLLGNGTCSCAASSSTGFWSGPQCDQCRLGYYGSTCKQQCPHTPEPQNQTSSILNASTVCGGHGTCLDGTFGSGTCVCDRGHVGLVCEHCEAGYYGSRCQACPSVGSAPCSGHGACHDGRSGTGVCTCALGYGGSMCQFQCAVKSNATCDRGTCVGDNDCKCSPWAAKDSGTGLCSKCIDVASWGPLCSFACPLCVYGSCDPDTGKCVCSFGRWGTLCNETCPGGAVKPCSGHGVCDPINGQCICSQSLVTGGYYAGATCSECDPRYHSATCSIACPTSDGVVCSGRSTCWNGVCELCLVTAIDAAASAILVCGDACEKLNSQCTGAERQCSDIGAWGPGCASLCPGTTAGVGGVLPCSGNGVCNTDTGACVCAAGFGGDVCMQGCARGYASSSAADTTPCSSRGTCNSTTLVCSCRRGYWGAACQYECPGGATMPCSNRGVCSVEGFCECDGTAFGSACEHPCPGGFDNPCSGHGVCASSSGSCSCSADATLGYFSGSACDTCAPLYSGTACTVYCDPRVGAVAGDKCVCAVGFVGAACTLLCPRDTAGNVCGGHGSCVAALSNDTAVCLCHVDWYGPSCSTYCTVEYCITEKGLVRPQCDVATGDCVCQQSETFGSFAGATCSDCAAVYWGSECSMECPCNGHGSCDRAVGSCRCFADAESGHWSGSGCSQCAAGYIGLTCTTKNVEFSQISSADVMLANTGFPRRGVLFRDASTQLVFVGAMPVVVFRYDDWGDNSVIPLGQIAVPHPALSCRVASNGTRLEFTLDLGGAQFGRWSTPRTLEGGLLDMFAEPAARHAAQLEVNTTDAFMLTSSDDESGCTAVAVAAVELTRVLLACPPLPSGNDQDLNSTTEFVVSGAPNWMDFSGDLLLVATVNQTTHRWCVAAISLRIRSLMFVQSSATLSLPLCGDSCRYVSFCVHVAALTDVVCAVALPDVNRVLLLRLALHDGGNLHATSPSTLLLSGGFDVTAAAVDDDYRFLLLATKGGITNAVVRVFVPTMTLVSQLDMPMLSGTKPTILRMAVNVSSRTLYASVATSDAVRAATINLFGLLAVAPEVIDQLGGTAVTFTGEGFISSPPPVCVFDNEPTSRAPAVFIDNRTIVCNATFSRYRDINCESVSVNVQYGNRTTNTTILSVVRPASVALNSAISNTSLTSFGWHGDATDVLVDATGLVTSAARATCRLLNPLTKLIYFTTPVVRFVNGSVVVCRQPPLPNPTSSAAVLVYSHDGFVFSSSSTTYVVVGEYTGLTARWAPARQLVAGQRTAMATVDVRTVDAAGNELAAFDVFARVIRCALLPPLLLVTEDGFTENTVARNLTWRGQALLTSLILTNPAVGTRPLFCFDAFDFTRYTRLDFTVVPGPIVGMRLTSQTSPWVGAVTSFVTLTPAPLLVCVDAAANIVSDVGILPAVITLDYAQQYPTVLSDIRSAPVEAVVRMASSPDPSGVYTYSPVSVRTTFGRPLQLRFSTSILPNVTLSMTLRAEKCVAPFQYAVAGTFQCALCPANAACDGSQTITPAPGFWRLRTTSTVLYPCDPPTSCVSPMTCAAGYKGAYCGACEEGYGRSGGACMPCQAAALNWSVTALLIAALSVAIYVLSVRSLPFSSLTDRDADLVPKETQGNPVALVVKIGVSHLQLLSLLPLGDLTMPSWLSAVLEGGGAGAAVSPNLSFVSCATGNSAKALILSAAAEVPIFLGIFSAVSLLTAYQHHRRFFNEAQKALRAARRQEAKAADASPVLYSDADAANLAVLFHDVLPAAADELSDPTSSSAEQRKSEAQVHAEDGISTSTGMTNSQVPTEPVYSPEELYEEAVKSHKDLLEWYDGDCPGGLIAVAGDKRRTKMIVLQEPEPTETAVALKEAMARLEAQNVPPPPFWERLTNVFAVSSIVVLFFIYPTLVQVAIQALQCSAIESGVSADDTYTVMTFDTSVRCQSAEYAVVSKYASLLLVFGGVCVPLLCPLVILLITKATCRNNMAQAQQLFFFATGGYRLWFWESVSMLRKAIIAILVALINGEPQLQFLLCVWMYIVFFVFNARLRPWSDPLYSRAEAVSMFALAATAFLFSISFTRDIAGDDVRLTIVFACALVVNVLFFAFAGVSLLVAVRRHVRSLAKKNAALGELLVTMEDLATQQRVASLTKTVAVTTKSFRSQYPRQFLLSDMEVDFQRDLSIVENLLKSTEAERRAFDFNQKLRAALPTHIAEKSFRVLANDIGSIDDASLVDKDAGFVAATVHFCSDDVDSGTTTATNTATHCKPISVRSRKRRSGGKPAVRIGSPSASSSSPLSSPSDTMLSSVEVMTPDALCLQSPSTQDTAPVGLSYLLPAAFSLQQGKSLCAVESVQSYRSWQRRSQPEALHAGNEFWGDRFMSTDMLSALAVFDMDEEEESASGTGAHKSSQLMPLENTAANDLFSEDYMTHIVERAKLFDSVGDLETDDEGADNGYQRPAELQAVDSSFADVGASPWAAQRAALQSAARDNPLQDDLFDSCIGDERFHQFYESDEASSGSWDADCTFTSHQVVQFRASPADSSGTLFHGEIDVDCISHCSLPSLVNGGTAVAPDTNAVRWSACIDVDDLLQAMPYQLAAHDDPPRPALTSVAPACPASAALPFSVTDDDIDISLLDANVDWLDSFTPRLTDSFGDDMVQRLADMSRNRRASDVLRSPPLHSLPQQRVGSNTSETSWQKLRRALRNARRSQSLLLALHHVIPRRIYAAANHTTSETVLQRALLQNAEALFSAEVVLTLSWLRIVRLCKELKLPLATVLEDVDIRVIEPHS